MADKDSRAGARYATEDILSYVNRTHASHDAGLAQAFAVPEGMPAIQVGPSEGRFLYLLMKMIGAKKVVEVGTLAGYSAIHMARALPADGHLWTIEYAPKHADVARANIAAAGLADRVTVLVGAGREVLPTLKGPVDAVFIDADKENYANYYEALLPRLAATGLMAIDNTLWSGRVLDEGDDEETTRVIRELNDRIVADERVVAVQLTVRDGVTLIRRKA